MQRIATALLALTVLLTGALINAAEGITDTLTTPGVTLTESKARNVASIVTFLSGLIA